MNRRVFLSTVAAAAFVPALPAGVVFDATDLEWQRFGLSFTSPCDHGYYFLWVDDHAKLRVKLLTRPLFDADGSEVRK